MPLSVVIVVDDVLNAFGVVVVCVTIYFVVLGVGVAGAVFIGRSSRVDRVLPPACFARYVTRANVHNHIRGAAFSCQPFWAPRARQKNVRSVGRSANPDPNLNPDSEQPYIYMEHFQS